jgi:hypothetical protein
MQEYFFGEAPLPFRLEGFHPSTIRDRELGELAVDHPH